MDVKKKLILVLLFGSFLILILTGKANASSFTATLTPSTTSVVKGNTVTVTISISNMDTTSGIYEVSATLDYDTAVFEEISTSNIAQATGWSPNYDSSTKLLTLTNTTAVTTETEIATITLQVKSDTTASTADFKLTSIKGMNSSLEESTASDVSTTFTIGSSVVIGNNLVYNSINNTDNTVDGNVADENFVNEVQNLIGNNTTSNSNVPDAGSEDYIIPLIFVVIILGIISFVNYKRIDTKNPKIK